MAPEVVVLVKTWQGPNEKIAHSRLECAAKMFASMDTNLHYPNYSWHIADDGSEEWYQEQFLALLGKRPYTFTTSGANGDIGRNLNVAMREVFKRTDYILQWSDDLRLISTMNIGPYVELLRKHQDIGYVATGGCHPSLHMTPVELDGCTWHVVDKSSPNRYLIITSLHLVHRRAWDFYGPYPEGLRIDTMQEEMKWRYQTFKNGLKMVYPDELFFNERARSFGLSTWNWRLKNQGELNAWHRYRSYNARFERG